MIQMHTPRAQRGAVLVVGLIVMMLITLMVTAAFKFSTYNLKSVGNMLSSNEAIAAANQAIEKVVGTWSFATPPGPLEYQVDIDNNGTNDYTVAIATPTCVRAIPARIGGSLGDDCRDELGALTTCTSALAAASKFNVIWDVPATATSSNGTTVRVRQGVSLSLTKAQCTAACPPAPGQPCV
jgi:hypothetical protein